MLIPERICTLSLVSTTSGLFRTTVSLSLSFILVISYFVNLVRVHLPCENNFDYYSNPRLVTRNASRTIFQPDAEFFSNYLPHLKTQMPSPPSHLFPNEPSNFMKPSNHQQGFVENLLARANLFIPKSLDTQIAAVKQNLYTPTWLSAPDTLPHVVQSFPTNGDRFAANELWKRQQPDLFGKPGFMLQAIAAGWHAKSPAQLQQLSAQVGKKRIMVVHGTQDRMITFPHGVVLWRGLESGAGRTGKENWLGVEEEEDVWVEGEVEKHFVKGQGHVLPVEMRGEFNGWLEGLIERGVKLNAEA